MIIVVNDPQCSALSTFKVDCTLNKKKIEKELIKLGFDRDSYCGDVVSYVAIGNNDLILTGSLDYT